MQIVAVDTVQAGVEKDKDQRNANAECCSVRDVVSNVSVKT